MAPLTHVGGLTSSAGRWVLSLATASLIVVGMQGPLPHSPVAHAALNDSSVILNETGGLTADDGLIIKVGAGWRSIGRNSAQQVYLGRGTDWTDDPDDQAAWIAETTSQAVRPYNGIILQVDNTSICFDARPEEEGECFLSTYLGELDEGMTPVSWDSATTTLVDPTGPTYQAVTVLEKEIPARGNPDDLVEYVLTVTTDYTSPNSFATVTYSLAVPADADHDAINLYDGIDMLLDFEDYGPATTFVQGGRRTVVQYNDTAMGGFREVPAAATDDTERFGSYTAADYPCLFGASTFGPSAQCPPSGGNYGPYNGSPYPNELTEDPDTDIGVGIAWALGDASTLAGGTVTRQSELFFTAPFILSSAFSAASVASGSMVDVVYTVNASIPGSSYSDIGFDVNLPPGATVAGALTNTCGGDAEETGGLVSLSAGTLAAPAQTCTVTVPVSFSTIGTVSLDDSQFVSGSASGLSIIPALSGSIAVTSPQPPPVFPPSAPRDVTAVPGDRSVSVSWREPASSGSFPVSTYKATAAPGGASCLTATLSCTVSGLTNGTPYTFTVEALNGAGWGPRGGPTAPVTPGGVTPAPAPVPLPAPLAPGGSVLQTNGVVDPDVEVDPNTGDNGLVITGDSWSMDLDGLGPDGKPLNLGPDGSLRLANERDVQTKGTGFLANSEVDLYVDPPVLLTGASARSARSAEAIYVGTLRTDAQGTFAGVVTLPEDITPGDHVLQAVGYSPERQTRALSLGVIVEPWIVLDQGTRKADGLHDRIRTTGTTGGIEAGTRLTPFIRYSGTKTFSQGKATITVQSDGSFRWTREISKRRGLTAYVAWTDIESNRVFWAKVR